MLRNTLSFFLPLVPLLPERILCNPPDALIPLIVQKRIIEHKVNGNVGS